MYRIRTYNSDGTLGDFWSDEGLVSNPALAKTYSTTHEAQEDIDRSYKNLGLNFFPKLNYNVSTEALAEQEKTNEDYTQYNASPMSVNQFSVTTQPLPPFEDKPSRSITVSTAIEVLDFDGGSALSSQDLDVDGGSA